MVEGVDAVGARAVAGQLHLKKWRHKNKAKKKKKEKDKNGHEKDEMLARRIPDALV